MDLIPSSKPVRIRIVSGGEEHSSLETLRNKFSLKDLLPSVKDGRLERWLRQKNEKELADKISTLSFSSDLLDYDEEEISRFICVFFPDYKDKSISELLESLEGRDNAFYLIRFLPFMDILKRYERNPKTLSEYDWRVIFTEKLCRISLKVAIEIFKKGILKKLLSETSWEVIFSNRRNGDPMHFFYNVYEALSEVPAYKEIAVKYLKKSAELGHPAAVKYFKDEERQELINKFLNNPVVYNWDAESGSELHLFLMIAGKSLEREWDKGYLSSKYQKVGIFSKYLMLVEILRRKFNEIGFDVNSSIDEIKKLEEKYPGFVVARLIREAYSQRLKINNKSFMLFTYKETVVYLVKLMKEYEEF